MASGDGGRRGLGKERLKRWLRIHVLARQSRDLFYPMYPGAGGNDDRAELVLTDPNSVPQEIFINGERTGIVRGVDEGGTMRCWLERSELVLPGENIVSLPVSCDPSGLALQVVGRVADAPAIGWGSVQGVQAETGFPGTDDAASFLVRSLSRDTFGDGMVSLTAWDPVDSGVRLWSWYWTTGIVYEALGRLVSAGEMALDLAPLEQGLLSRQVLKGESDVRGSYMVRWDPDRTLASGIVPWHAPNDAAYLGLHGLLVADGLNDDPVWLERALLLAEWIIGAGMVEGRLRVGWDAGRCRWIDTWYYVDAAWTPAFFIALAGRTGDPDWLTVADTLAQDTITRLGTNGPFYLKIWRANGRHTRSIFSRGMAWVLEGWIPMLAAGRDWILPRVEHLVEGILQHQEVDGSWPYLLDRPETGACNKGTPALAYHLQRASGHLPALADRIAESVERALTWCDAQMITDPESPARGGIVSHSFEGAIATVRDIPTAFNFASAYYLLARKDARR